VRSAKIDALEGMRAVCALLVIATHFLNISAGQPFALANPSFRFLTNLFYGAGAPSVWVFFVLSGFVMAHRYREPFDQAALVEYLRRRLLRIWPLMSLAIVLAIAVEGFPEAKVWLGNLAFLQGFLVVPLPSDPPLWSLSYEFFYYVVFGFVMRGLLPRQTFLTCGTAGVLLSWFFDWQGFEVLACILFWAAGYWLARNMGRTALLRPAPGNAALRALSLLLLATAYHFGSLIPSAIGLMGGMRVMALGDVVISPIYLAIIAETLGLSLTKAKWFWALIALIALSCVGRV
jgi:peptidoglycan/LPS O-acetylase OafA/YrhL